MKGSLIVLGLFVAGIALGMSPLSPQHLIPDELTEWLLYALIIQIGISLGASGNLRRIMSSVSAKTLVLPLCTVAGTLLFTAIAGLCLGRLPLWDYLALGSGLGYYSLSSVIIIDIKSDVTGLQAATAIGLLAVLTNIIREIIALVGGPWFARTFGPYAPTAAAGVTSMDVTLPMIVQTCGQEMFPIALMHGMILEVSVPVLVTLFASL